MKFCSPRAIQSVRIVGAVSFLTLLLVSLASRSFADDAPEFRTPKSGPAPHINGPSIFGVRPGSPFLYRIPASGDRPIQFEVSHLPSGLQLDSKTGEISGSLKRTGEYAVTLRAKNSAGHTEKKFRMVVGETIALTLPNG